MSALAPRAASRPSVALDCRLLHWPGIGRYCAELARALVAVAPDIDFHWLCNPGQEAALPQAANARALTVRSRPMGLAEQVELPWLLRRHRIDLLHAATAQTFAVAAPKLVLTVHDLTLLHFPEFLPSLAARLYFRLMSAVAARRPRRLVAVSAFTGGDVAQSWPRAAARVVVVRNGVSASFAPVTDPAALQRVRQAMALPPRFVLYIGTWKRHKNLPRLLTAYAALPAAQRARCPLVVVAPTDPRYPEVSAAAQQGGIADEVCWRSGVDEAMLPALYSAARCVVLPSLYEGFGYPVAEAMACGTPAVVSTAAALPEVGGDACLRFAPEDVAALTDCLARLIDDDALHADLVRRCLRRAPQFDNREVGRRMAEVYREVMA